MEKKIINIMDRLPFFDAFNSEEKRIIASLSANFRVYQPGDTIIEEGSTETTMFVLLSGKVRVRKGPDTPLGIELKPGDIFGEIGYLTSTPRTADVMAETVVIALEMDKKLLFELASPIREKIKDKIIEKLICRLVYMNSLYFVNRGGHPAGPPSQRLLSGMDPGGLTDGGEGLIDGEAVEADPGGLLKQEILAKVKELPPMPDVLMKAQEILADPSTGPHEAARLLATDQAIAARVLRVANSAYYGFPGKISSIEKASALFGTKLLRKLLGDMSVSSLGRNYLKGYGVKSGDQWRHALATACSARCVAEISFPEMAEDAYMAGLLHDCGKLVLDNPIYERKERFKKEMADGRRSFLDAERAILGFDHAEIAYALCSRWKIPEFIAIAIRYHHKPSHSGSNLLAHLVHYGNHLAIKSRLGASTHGGPLTLDRYTRKILNFKKREFDGLLSNVKADFDHAAQAFLI